MTWRALPDQYGIEAFNFGKLFSGAKERRPRWKRVIQAENNLLGELLGQLYVKEFFSEKAKQLFYSGPGGSDPGSPA